MADDYDLSRRKLLTAAGTIGAATALGGASTVAFFSDEENFANNQLVAGELDMKMGYSAHYSDWSPDEDGGDTATTDDDVDVVMWDGAPDTTGGPGDVPAGHTGLPTNAAWLIAVDDPDQFLDNTQYAGDGTASCGPDGTDAGDLEQPVIDLEDVKPGDFGEVTFDFALCDNPGFVWLQGELISCAENGVTEPEARDDDENEDEPREADESSLWPLAALAGVPALGGDDGSGGADEDTEFEAVEMEADETTEHESSDGRSTLRKGAAAAGVGAAGLGAASGLASADSAKGSPPDPNPDNDVSIDNGALSVDVGEQGSSGFSFAGDSTVFFEFYGFRDGSSGTHVEATDSNVSVTDPFPSSVSPGTTASSTLSYPVPTSGGTAVDLEVKRNATLDTSEPILRIEYEVTNPSDSGATFSDLRLSQYVDYDIGGISNNIGRYFFDSTTGCEFIWQETEGADIFAGFTAEEQSVAHGLTTYSTGTSVFSSDDISSILNGDDIHPDSGTTDVELTFEWSLGELEPGDTATLQTSFVYNQQGQAEFEDQICQESPGEPEPEPTECADVELLDVVQAAAWVDDGDNYQDGDEQPAIVGSLRSVLNQLSSGAGLGLPGDTPAPDGGGAEGARNCFSPETTHSVAFAWWVPVDHGNEIQTDSATFDLSFYTEQCRHNDGSGQMGNDGNDTPSDPDTTEVTVSAFPDQGDDLGATIEVVEVTFTGGLGSFVSADWSAGPSGDQNVSVDGDTIRLEYPDNSIQYSSDTFLELTAAVPTGTSGSAEFVYEPDDDSQVDNTDSYST